MYKDLIRKRIKEKFGTIENFARYMDIPRTTINFILKSGVHTSNYGMVCNILRELDIYAADGLPVALDDALVDFIHRYNALDDKGKHTVAAVAETEYRRVHPDTFEDVIIAAYAGLTAGKPLTEDEKLILDLVEKIKKDKHEK